MTNPEKCSPPILEHWLCGCGEGRLDGTIVRGCLVRSTQPLPIEHQCKTEIDESQSAQIRHTTGQATWHCSPDTMPVPDQRNAPRRLSMVLIIHGDRHKTKERWVWDSRERERLTRVLHAWLDSKAFLFQGIIMFATVATRGCSSLFSL